MIEKMARAICRAGIMSIRPDVGERHWQDFEDINWPSYVHRARAALEALREPTMEMGLSGADAVNKQMRGPGAPADYDAAMDCFRAMIDKVMEVGS